MNTTLVNTITTGLNNPECAFWVGQSLGTLSIGFIAFRLALIYYGIKLLDKLIFKGIPKTYEWIQWKRRFRL